MPLHEYKCMGCGDRLERLELGREAIAERPICGFCGQRMVRLMSAPAVHFKGSGFYKTDYNPTKGEGE